MSKTKAISTVWKPTALEASKKLQGGGEVSALKLAAGGGAAFVSIYDASSVDTCNENNLRWVLDASTTVIDSQCFTEPLTFEKGVVAICEQGIGFNPVVCLAMTKYVV